MKEKLFFEALFCPETIDNNAICSVLKDNINHITYHNCAIELSLDYDEDLDLKVFNNSEGQYGPIFEISLEQAQDRLNNLIFRQFDVFLITHMEHKIDKEECSIKIYLRNQNDTVYWSIDTENSDEGNKPFFDVLFSSNGVKKDKLNKAFKRANKSENKISLYSIGPNFIIYPYREKWFIDDEGEDKPYYISLFNISRKEADKRLKQLKGEEICGYKVVDCSFSDYSDWEYDEIVSIIINIKPL